MGNITIDMNLYTAITVDLTDFDFRGITKVVMNFKNKPLYKGEPLFSRTFLTAEKHNVIITPEESLMLEEGAEYDIVKVLGDNTCYKVGENGTITLRWGCGKCQV